MSVRAAQEARRIPKQPEQLIRKLRGAERLLGEGRTMPEAAKGLEGARTRLKAIKLLQALGVIAHGETSAR
jgi:hypothetical protein